MLNHELIHLVLGFSQGFLIPENILMLAPSTKNSTKLSGKISLLRKRGSTDLEWMEHKRIGWNTGTSRYSNL